MGRPEIDVGRTLREMASEAGEAWKAAEAGRIASSRPGTYFRDWSALNAVLTPKRYDLLRHLRRERASGVRALARSLGRDVKRVHEDVVALAEIGFLTRDEDGGLSSDVDEIESTIHISPSAANPSSERPSDLRDLAGKSVEEAHRAFDGLMIVTLEAIGQTETGDTVGGTETQTIGAKAMGFAQSNIRSALDLASKLVRAKDLHEAMALQADYAKAQMTTMQEQAREFGTIVRTNAEGVANSMSAGTEKRREGADRA